MNEVDDFRSIGSLPREVAMRASGFERLQTQYGEKVKCILEVPCGDDIEQAVVIPPTRLYRTDAQISKVNAAGDRGSPPHIIYHGKMGAAFNISMRF